MKKVFPIRYDWWKIWNFQTRALYYVQWLKMFVFPRRALYKVQHCLYLTTKSHCKFRFSSTWGVKINLILRDNWHTFSCNGFSEEILKPLNLLELEKDRLYGPVRVLSVSGQWLGYLGRGPFSIKRSQLGLNLLHQITAKFYSNP